MEGRWRGRKKYTASTNLTGASNLHRPRERACKGNQKPLPRLLPFLMCFPYSSEEHHSQVRLERGNKQNALVAAKALVLGDFEIWMKRIIEVTDSRVHKYLKKISPAQWATSYAPTRKWGISTSNSSKSSNDQLDQRRTR
jgi:hypothetical protein